MTWRAIATTIGFLTLASPLHADDRSGACLRSALRVGDCVTVHARLTTCTGIPNARLWVIGTKRVLGVADADAKHGGEKILPHWLDETMFSAMPCSKAAYGDFTVCPLSPDRPGVMRTVCVADVANIVLRDW
ncbi:hypothetical protein CU669_07840 [Paramagnetospirillum kuznetsovii]|uniref:Uncharacterized protein n=1 Tax=Paramagnetospirillum kuznetsovii TaxID=2053833 RepID=A0A364NZS6_9PROT|nr:hypothetical protein [Paramagnetospirillum kuznetsovii]RAU22588.1 hypothetical protein CU669_07840 [Paramagnetospirillum kuznetsovii]